MVFLKIAFPIEKEGGTEQKVSLHFGPSPYFLLLGGNGEVASLLKNTSAHFGGGKMPPEFLKENGVGKVVCCDMGPKAVEMCAELGIEVYFVSEGASVGEAFTFLGQGKLRKVGLGDGCESHQE